MYGFEFDKQIDIGHFLTFLTLLAGFSWWLYTTIKEWRRTAEEDARSGALRLMLKILREKGGSMAMNEIFAIYQSPEMKSERKGYCGRNWLFKNERQFEGAVYRLHWESKIDFVSGQTIRLRMAADPGMAQQFHATSGDIGQLLAILKDALERTAIPTWELERIAESCMRIAPKEAEVILRDGLRSTAEDVSVRVASIIGHLVPSAAKIAT